MAEDTVTITVRVPIGVAEALTELGGGPSAGGRQVLADWYTHARELRAPSAFGPSGWAWVCGAWESLIRATWRALHGTFAREELLLIADVLNGTLLTPQVAGQHVGLAVADGIALDGLDSKWGVDGDDLRAKLGVLTPFECAALEVWAALWWAREGAALQDPAEDTRLLRLLTGAS